MPGQVTKQSEECSGQWYVKYDEARHKDEWINFVSLGGPVQSWKREGSAEWVGAGGAGEPAGEEEVLVEEMEEDGSESVSENENERVGESGEEEEDTEESDRGDTQVMDFEPDDE